MLHHKIQTLIWKSDKYFASVVAYLPSSLQSVSAKLGHMTLPSIWAAAILIATLANVSSGNQKLATFGFAIIACIPIGTILKLIVRRARPKTLYTHNMRIKSYSFPSSHTYSATLAGGYFIILSLILLAQPTSILISVLLTVFVTIIGLSRIHVGAHYPTDVIGGWLLGSIVLFAVVQVVF